MICFAAKIFNELLTSSDFATVGEAWEEPEHRKKRKGESLGKKESPKAPDRKQFYLV